MSAKRAALVSLIVLTSFVSLSVFFASLAEINPTPNNSLSVDGYGIGAQNSTSNPSYKPTLSS